MGKYSVFLYDNIGNTYERKNKYLLELALLDEKIKSEKDNVIKQKLKKERREVKRNKGNHSYIISLRDYEKKEKEFLNELKRSKKVYIKELKEDKTNRKLIGLKTRLFESEKKLTFYKEYIDLSYDAEFEYRKANLDSIHLPKIIEFFVEGQKELNIALNEKEELKNLDEKDFKNDFKKFKVSQKEIFKNEKLRIKKLRKEGLISKKAEENGIKELKKKYENALEIKKRESKKFANKEFIKTKKYELKKDLKTMTKVLEADISDFRRKTPVEIEKTIPYYSYLTILIPGLGQGLNKQYMKMFLFFIATLFIYLVAIPYALGYGNYQGQGIAGLINLAEGGLRIHKSIIFLIEGIVAVFLSIIAVVMLIISFIDAHKVEKNVIKGIRPSNWFETRMTISEDGFPYVVSLPALLIIVFIVLVPIMTTFLLSFTNMDPQHQSKFTWIGITNYKMIIMGEGLAGRVFWLILGWTVIWTLAATTLAILIGFVLALLVNNERIKGKKFFRTIYLLPWAVPAFITIMFFSIMLAPRGVLTEIINNIVGMKIEIKNDPTLTRIALILMQGWLGSSYIFILTTGVLQAIPGDLYEAADMDGATAWDKIRRITVPLVLFQTAPLLVTQYTFNFNNFSAIFLFNGGGPFDPIKYGNLAGSSDILISYIYKLTMDNQYQAIGAAITMFISLGLMLFTFIGFKNSKQFKEGRL
ncbi:ABC transporter permease subunit [Soehngenia longivitae]|uniref:ABC transporter permease subunit n=1 Tax=Soehngenia longivitae TaxID=2562294 RepID=A0A4Z0D2Y1_9FIRM|nr:ABC transporter permease subunit [Soehngenia longivitae]TFZ39685.1 ABC transporter permease subunit [Soehngenia longivitae]